MANVVALVLIGFAPGVFWLWFFVKRDVYRPEPKRQVAVTFALGMISTVPAGILSALFLSTDVLEGDPGSLASLAMVMLFVVGPVEETCKFLAVRWHAFRSLHFDEPIDGLVYAAAASLGFASVENVLYMINFGAEVIILRGPLSTVGHVVFAAFWGEALGRRLGQGRWSGGATVLIGLTIAAVAHGTFNVLVSYFWPGAIAMIAVGLWWVVRRFGWARRASPFRLRRNYPRIECSFCGQRISVANRFCNHCRASVPMDLDGPLWCSHCEQPNRVDAAYCTGCGDRLELPPGSSPRSSSAS